MLRILFQRKFIRLYDVLAILLFSVLANYVFSLPIDFRKPIDIFAVARLLSLAVGSMCMYLVMTQMSEVAEYASEEYLSERSNSRRADKSVDARYSEYIPAVYKRLCCMWVCGLTFSGLFFLLDPIVAAVAAVR
ncbi:hypothetical protein E3G67_003691 [Mycobacteroides abscessus]|nr:hypothetical protein [Mycobacteroides abscessus]